MGRVPVTANPIERLNAIRTQQRLLQNEANTVKAQVDQGKLQKAKEFEAATHSAVAAVALNGDTPGDFDLQIKALQQGKRLAKKRAAQDQPVEPVVAEPVDAEPQGGESDGRPAKRRKGPVEPQTFHCELCDRSCPTQKALDKHLGSKVHARAAALKQVREGLPSLQLPAPETEETEEKKRRRELRVKKEHFDATFGSGVVGVASDDDA
jgi:hypothetical protein